MRLQLIPGTSVISLLLIWSTVALAQQDDSIRLDPIQMDFLFSYYAQDGENSAVTGGSGTEELEDWSGKIQLNIPLDSTARLKISGGLNHYSSASTDRIDFRISSASSVDNRVEAVLDYGRDFGQGEEAFSYRLGASIESDYLSSSIGGTRSWRSADRSRTISLDGTLYLDRWIVYFPEELRRDSLLPSIPTDRRRSLNASLTWEQAINRRIHAALVLEPGVQQGLLSTPFHRVYFEGAELPGIETFPTWKSRIAAAVQLNTLLAPFLVSRTGYRFYADDFGVIAHTLNLEFPLKASTVFSFSPYYRFHRQSASRYFAPFASHSRDEEYYTSDWDLSAFDSHLLGVFIRWEPVFGVGGRPSEGKISAFRGIYLRGSWYTRSDGLQAWSTTLHTSWQLYR